MNEVLKVGNNKIEGLLKLEVIDKNTGEVVEAQEVHNAIFSKVNKLLHLAAVTSSLTTISSSGPGGMYPILAGMFGNLLLFNVESGEEVGVDINNMPKNLVAVSSLRTLVGTGSNWGGLAAESLQPVLIIDENGMPTVSAIYEFGTNVMNYESVNVLYLFSNFSIEGVVYSGDHKVSNANFGSRTVMLGTRSITMKWRASNYSSVNFISAGKNYFLIRYFDRASSKTCFMIINNRTGSIVYDSSSDGTTLSYNTSQGGKYMMFFDYVNSSVIGSYLVNVATGSVSSRKTYTSFRGQTGYIPSFIVDENGVGYRVQSGSLYRIDYMADSPIEEMLSLTALKTALLTSGLTTTLKAAISDVALNSVYYDGKRGMFLLLWTPTVKSGYSLSLLNNFIYSDLSGNYMGHGLSADDYIFGRRLSYKTVTSTYLEDGIEYTDYTFKSIPNYGGPSSFIRLNNPISKTSEQILRVTYTIKGSVDANFLEEELAF